MEVLRMTFSYFLLIFINTIFVNCSGDSSTDGNSDGDLSVSIPLDGGMQNIQLPANQVVNFMLTLQVPPEIKMVESATIDVKETLKNASVSFEGNFLKAAFMAAFFQDDVTGSMFIKVGDTPETACSSTITYGPYNLSAGFFGSPEPQEISLDQPSIQIVNLGTVALCMQMQSSVDAMISIEDIAVDVTQSDCPDAADFSGIWEGTYTCGSSCGGEFGGSIQLTVTQNGTSASYVDDGEYIYSGTVCGDVFRFKRTDEDETESGTLTLIDATHAVKRSTWRSLSVPTCFGNCVDSLSRVIN